MRISLFVLIKKGTDLAFPISLHVKSTGGLSFFFEDIDTTYLERFGHAHLCECGAIACAPYETHEIESPGTADSDKPCFFEMYNILEREDLRIQIIGEVEIRNSPRMHDIKDAFIVAGEESDILPTSNAKTVICAKEIWIIDQPASEAIMHKETRDIFTAFQMANRLASSELQALRRVVQKGTERLLQGLDPLNP